MIPDVSIPSTTAVHPHAGTMPPATTKAPRTDVSAVWDLKEIIASTTSMNVIPFNYVDPAPELVWIWLTDSNVNADWDSPDSSAM